MTSDLPPGWYLATLGECCTPVEKVDPREAPDAFFDYIDIGGIHPGSGRIEVTKRLRGCDAPSRARQRVRTGDVVLSTVRTYQRKTAIVSPSLDGAIASTGFCVLRPNRGVNSRFILHQLLSDDFVERLSEQQTGTSYPAVRDGDVRAMSVRITSEQEQERIVAAVEEHFSRLDAVDAGLASAVIRTTRLLQRVVDDQLRLADARSQPLSELLTEPLTNGRSVRTAPSGGDPVLRLTAIKEGFIDPAETKQGDFGDTDPNRFAIAPDDFLIARGNGSLRLVGRGGLVSEDAPPVAFPDTMIRARVDESRLNPRYLSLVWHSRKVRGQLESQARTTAGIYKVNQSMIGAVELPVPPLDIQRQIVRVADETRYVVASCAGSLDRCQVTAAALRRSILSRAFASACPPRAPGQ